MDVTITLHCLLSGVFVVSDNGGDWDDSEEYRSLADAQADAEEREEHYSDLGHKCTIEEA